MLKYMKKVCHSVGELNPGLPRDGRGYLPLYHYSHGGGHASIWAKLVILHNFLGQMGFVGHKYSVDSIKRTVHLTFHGLFFLLKVLFFWKIENSTFNRDSTKFICLENFQYLLQYVCEFKKFVLNLHTYIGT